MATLSIPVTLIPGTNENVSDVKTNFDAVASAVNSLDDSNIAAAAGIKESKLATGANGLANGVFSAYRNAALSLGTGAFIAFDAEEFDVSGWFDTAGAAGRYTPLVAGYYRLSWMVATGAALTVDNFWQCNMHKNATLAKSGQPMNYRTAALGSWSSGTAVVQANGSTDFFDVRVTHNQGGTLALSTGAANTWFAGELIGRS